MHSVHLYFVFDQLGSYCPSTISLHNYFFVLNILITYKCNYVMVIMENKTLEFKIITELNIHRAIAFYWSPV